MDEMEVDSSQACPHGADCPPIRFIPHAEFDGYNEISCPRCKTIFIFEIDPVTKARSQLRPKPADEVKLDLQLPANAPILQSFCFTIATRDARTDLSIWREFFATNPQLGSKLVSSIDSAICATFMDEKFKDGRIHIHCATLADAQHLLGLDDVRATVNDPFQPCDGAHGGTWKEALEQTHRLNFMFPSVKSTNPAAILRSLLPKLATPSSGSNSAPRPLAAAYEVLSQPDFLIVAIWPLTEADLEQAVSCGQQLARNPPSVGASSSLHLLAIDAPAGEKFSLCGLCHGRHPTDGCGIAHKYFVLYNTKPADYLATSHLASVLNHKEVHSISHRCVYAPNRPDLLMVGLRANSAYDARHFVASFPIHGIRAMTLTEFVDRSVRGQSLLIALLIFCRGLLRILLLQWSSRRRLPYSPDGRLEHLSLEETDGQPAPRLQLSARPLQQALILTTEDEKNKIKAALGSFSLFSSRGLKGGSGEPQNRQSQQQGLRRFRNFGNTCFMNSSLQAIFSSPSLMRSMVHDAHKSLFRHDSLITKLISLYGTKLPDKDLLAFIHEIGDRKPDLKRKADGSGKQICAQEFTHTLMECLLAELGLRDIRALASTTHLSDGPCSSATEAKLLAACRAARQTWNSEVLNRTSGIIKKTVIPPSSCGRPTATWFHCFLALNVPPNHPDLGAILDSRLRHSEQRQTKCDLCKFPHDITYEDEIIEFPEVLMVHIQRQEYHRIQCSEEKCNHPDNHNCHTPKTRPTRGPPAT
jgi:phage FluMu protein Com